MSFQQLVHQELAFFRFRALNMRAAKLLKPKALTHAAGKCVLQVAGTQVYTLCAPAWPSFSC